MPKKRNDYRINRYLDGKMSRREEAAFEEELKSNEELRETLNLHLDADSTINSHYKEESPDWLGHFKKRYNHLYRQPFAEKRNIIAVIALLFMILTTYLIIFKPFHSVKNPALFDRYYSTYELGNNYRSAGDFELDRGLRAYNKGNYEEALIFFENLLEIEPANAKAHFASGISALELNENRKAAEHFIKVMEADNLEFYQHAQWYLALTYLRMNKIQEAEVLLIALRNTGGYYHQKASDIIDSLN